jgi:electron transfer flavoprotein alpha subunit
MAACRGAEVVVVTVNRDPDGPVFGCSDLGIVADWLTVCRR